MPSAKEPIAEEKPSAKAKPSGKKKKPSAEEKKKPSGKKKTPSADDEEEPAPSTPPPKKPRTENVDKMNKMEWAESGDDLEALDEVIFEVQD